MPSGLDDLVRVALPRLASFLAEAAVLVLVLGILDRMLASQRLEPRWVGGAFLISAGLLAGSVLLDLLAGRWVAGRGSGSRDRAAVTR